MSAFTSTPGEKKQARIAHLRNTMEFNKAQAARVTREFVAEFQRAGQEPNPERAAIGMDRVRTAYLRFIGSASRFEAASGEQVDIAFSV